MPPTLDARLDAVLRLIRAESHADIGSDHAYLPLELVRSGQARRVVVVEVNAAPFARAQQNVARAGLGAQIDVRLGDGFAPLAPGEVQSASLTGMGATTVLGVLQRAGHRLPDVLVLQPNDSPRPLRVWARASGFRLVAEVLAPGHWTYPVLRFERGVGTELAYTDPAYAGLPLEAALSHGPLLLRENSSRLREQLEADLRRLTPLAAPGRPAQAELQVVLSALAYLDQAEPNKLTP